MNVVQVMEEVYESKTKHPVAPRLFGVECSGLQHPSHRTDRIPALSVRAESLIVRPDICCIPEICFWKAGEKAYGQNLLLYRRAALLP